MNSMEQLVNFAIQPDGNFCRIILPTNTVSCYMTSVSHLLKTMTELSKICKSHRCKAVFEMFEEKKDG